MLKSNQYLNQPNRSGPEYLGIGTVGLNVNSALARRKERDLAKKGGEKKMKCHCGRKVSEKTMVPGSGVCFSCFMQKEDKNLLNCVSCGMKHKKGICPEIFDFSGRRGGRGGITGSLWS